MPLGQRAGDNSESRYCGTEVAFSNDIHVTLSCNLAGGFDFIVAPLTNPNYRPHHDRNRDPTMGEAVFPFSGSDLVLSPSQWSSHVVGKISQWIDFDSNEYLSRMDSETTFRREISWASHLSLQACLLPTPREFSCENYARCVNQTLQNLSNMQLWLRIPLVDNSEEMKLDDDKSEKNLLDNKNVNDYWELWNKFHSLCEYHSQLSLALHITASLPSPNYIQKWIGEPLKAAFIHTSAFLTNKKGYPCLSKRHQNLILQLFDHSVQVVISGQPFHNTSYSESLGNESSENGWEDNQSLNHPLRPYLEYISHLYGKLAPIPEQEKFEMGYRDFLQAPLQPLMDNLEAQTYETFERDATKYSQYQLAIYEALIDTVPDELAETKTTVLMVVGAGRGPLVRSALQAAQEASRKLKIYAVEKNPNAVVTLHNLVSMEGWKDIVTIVSCDMREWNAPELADILVSELLGSFGDNELSPECLDGAQRFLKQDGISIPSSYTSYIGPITASKLYNDVKAYGDLAHFETAYVVKLHNISRLCDPKPVFTFVHPNRSQVIDNRRFIKLAFKLPEDTGSVTVHGFGGYFDAVLYKDVHLGIVPSFPTPNMFSWFPIFFPLRQPLHVPSGAEIQISFWRCVGKSKVWYEWAVSSPSASPIHNPNGRSYWVGL